MEAMHLILKNAHKGAVRPRASTKRAALGPRRFMPARRRSAPPPYGLRSFGCPAQLRGPAAPRKRPFGPCPRRRRAATQRAGQPQSLASRESCPYAPLLPACSSAPHGAVQAGHRSLPRPPTAAPSPRPACRWLWPPAARLRLPQACSWPWPPALAGRASAVRGSHSGRARRRAGLGAPSGARAPRGGNFFPCRQSAAVIRKRLPPPSVAALPRSLPPALRTAARCAAPSVAPVLCLRRSAMSRPCGGCRRKVWSSSINAILWHDSGRWWD